MTGSRRKVMDSFAQHHTPLNITMELATIETIKRFVQLKIGVAFVPRMCVEEELDRRALVSVPVEDLVYSRMLWGTYLRSANLSPAAEAFLKILREHATTHPTAGSEPQVATTSELTQ
jgi:DNA-binding transcriptional LysR family regulator